MGSVEKFAGWAWFRNGIRPNTLLYARLVANGIIVSLAGLRSWWDFQKIGCSTDFLSLIINSFPYTMPHFLSKLLRKLCKAAHKDMKDETTTHLPYDMQLHALQLRSKPDASSYWPFEWPTRDQHSRWRHRTSFSGQLTRTFIACACSYGCTKSFQLLNFHFVVITD